VEKVVPFYTDILGFEITDQGDLDGKTPVVFMSQDPDNHHQIAVAGTLTDGAGTRNLGHLAFRLESVDDLRALKGRLSDEHVEIRREISHGNTWSLYFADPEGNGVECFVDTPFHVRQPQGKSTDINLDDEALIHKTIEDFSGEPEFGSYPDWQERFHQSLKA
jgi:catechol 2,3-dioxygenase